jgi:hypothetical protein
MSTNPGLFKIAILDDYQNVARTMADWSILDGRAAITVFNDHLADADAVVARLQPSKPPLKWAMSPRPIANPWPPKPPPPKP